MAVLTAFSLFFAFLIGRRVSQGVKELAALALTLGEGKPMPPIAAPFREAAAITTALLIASRRRGARQGRS